MAETDNIKKAFKEQRGDFIELLSIFLDKCSMFSLIYSMSMDSQFNLIPIIFRIKY